ncbi:hypothetical protein ACWA2C_16135 [Priestia megaterium]
MTKDKTFFDVDAVVCTMMSKSEWTHEQAKHWYGRLTQLGVNVPSYDEFYQIVLNRFESFDAEMDAFFLRMKHQ